MWRSPLRCAHHPGAPDTPATATQVGAHRRVPIILTVDAAARHAAGEAFYQAANGGWLTDHAPPGYLSGWPG
jgi:putative RNA 2'-phosphotransferase